MTARDDPEELQPEWPGARPALPGTLPKGRPRRRLTSFAQAPGLRLMAVGMFGILIVRIWDGYSPARTGVQMALPIVWTAGWLASGVYAIWDLWRWRERKRLEKEHPDEPWLADHAWKSREASSRAISRYGKAIPLLAVTVGYWLGPRRLLPPRVALAVDLVLAALMAFVLVRCHRRAGVGDVVVTFGKLPFLAGDEIELTCGVASSGAGFSEVRFVLRCLREEGQRVHVLHAEEYEPADDQGLPGPDTFIELKFQVPQGAWGTRLWQEKPVYWELEVAGATSAGPYRDWFLVPVY